MTSDRRTVVVREGDLQRECREHDGLSYATIRHRPSGLESERYGHLGRMAAGEDAARGLGRKLERRLERGVEVPGAYLIGPAAEREA